MDIGGIILFLIALFFIVFFAVRLAIGPLMLEQGGQEADIQGVDLVKLRDMGVVNNDELEEILQMQREKRYEKSSREQYERYEKVLNGIIETGYFSQEQANNRIKILKEYFEDDQK